MVALLQSVESGRVGHFLLLSTFGRIHHIFILNKIKQKTKNLLHSFSFLKNDNNRPSVRRLVVVFLFSFEVIFSTQLFG